MRSSNYKSYEHFIRQFEHAKKQAEDLVRPLDERIFIRRPSAKSWCVGECFSHLEQAGRLYLGKIEKGIEKAEKNTAIVKHPMHLRFHMQWFVNYLEPPVSVKSQMPDAFKPVEYAKIEKEEVMNGFMNLQDQFLKQLELARSRNLDLAGIKVSNPLISLIRMSVAECIAVTEAHQRRHIEQAKKTLELL